jgi:hypothetical protein
MLQGITTIPSWGQLPLAMGAEKSWFLKREILERCGKERGSKKPDRER